jgi:hypothetical protein
MEMVAIKVVKEALRTILEIGLKKLRRASKMLCKELRMLVILREDNLKLLSNLCNLCKKRENLLGFFMMYTSMKVSKTSGTSKKSLKKH